MVIHAGSPLLGPMNFDRTRTKWIGSFARFSAQITSVPDASPALAYLAKLHRQGDGTWRDEVATQPG